jgi:hypothetical protein
VVQPKDSTIRSGKDLNRFDIHIEDVRDIDDVFCKTVVKEGVYQNTTEIFVLYHFGYSYILTVDLNTSKLLNTEMFFVPGNLNKRYGGNETKP